MMDGFRNVLDTSVVGGSTGVPRALGKKVLTLALRAILDDKVSGRHDG